MQVTDSGIPPKTAPNAATVIVKVTRNKNSPLFSNLPSTVELVQTAQRGELVFKVEATDRDKVMNIFIMVSCIASDY